MIALAVANALNFVLGTILVYQMASYSLTENEEKLSVRYLVALMGTTEAVHTGKPFPSNLARSFCVVHLCICLGAVIVASLGAMAFYQRGYGVLPAFWSFSTFTLLPSSFFLLRTESRAFLGVYSTIRMLNLPVSSAAYCSSLQLLSYYSYY